MSATHPFTGLVVIDFTHVLAGPACSHYLGLLGAKVIKVESPQKGDAIRHRGGTDLAAAASGMSTSYLSPRAAASHPSRLILKLRLAPPHSTGCWQRPISLWRTTSRRQ